MMDFGDIWFGLVIGLICAIPVVAVTCFAEHPKFAGSRQKLAAWVDAHLPFAVTEPFHRVYGSPWVKSANRKALLEARKRGIAQAKAKRRKGSH